MSARETIRNVLLVHYANSPDPALVVDTLMANDHAEVVAERDAMTVTWLTKKAREYRATPKSRQENAPDAIDRLASKLARGAVRPDNLRMLPADFFEPGHAYTSSGKEFRCVAVTPSPTTGERRAIGWALAPVYDVRAWHPTALDPDDWTHGDWTDVTEAGAS